MGVEPVVFVNRPEIPSAGLSGVASPAEQRPDAIDCLAFSSRKNHQWPRRTPFSIFPLPIDGVRDTQRPEVRSGISLWRSQVIVEWQQGLLVGGIGRSKTDALVEKYGPKSELFIVPADKFLIPPMVGSRGDFLMLAPKQRPHLPTVQSIAVPEMEERKEIIVRHYILFSALSVQGEENEIDFITKEAVSNSSVNWQERGVVLLGDLGTLLKVEREEREFLNIRFGLRLPTGEVEELQDVKSIFATVSIVTDPFPKKVELLVISILIEEVGEDGWRSPNPGQVVLLYNLLLIIERPQSLGTMSGVKRQIKLVKEWAEG